MKLLLLILLPFYSFGQMKMEVPCHDIDPLMSLEIPSRYIDAVIDSAYDKVIFVDSDSVVRQRTAKIIYKRFESEDSSFLRLPQTHYEVISVWVDNKMVDPKQIIR